MYDLYSRPVEGQLKKANRQIRETKQHFGMKSTKGLLLIANDGNLALPPLALMHILFKAINSKFHSINTFVFFTVNLFSRVSETRKPTLLWFGGSRGNSDDVPEQFTKILGETWAAYLENYQGIKIDKLYSPGIEGLEQVRLWNQPAASKTI
jgi:hypothetical protein